MKKKIKDVSQYGKAVFFRCTCSVILVVTLVFDLLMIGDTLSHLAQEAGATYTPDGALGLPATISFGIVMLILTFYELSIFLYKRAMGDRTRKSFWTLGYMAICLVSSALAFAAVKVEFLSSIAAILFFGLLSLKRVLHLIAHRRKVRDVVMDVLVGVVLFVLVLAELFAIQEASNLGLLLAGIVIVLTCLVNIIRLALSNFNSKVLGKIIRKTYAGEVIFGLCLLIVAFSIVMMHIEPQVETFTDGLWYCFAIITTIGFGDIVATSVIGRLLSVILGLYGIVVVAIFTSIIVNFYNEIRDVKEEEAQFAVPDDVGADETPDDGGTDEVPAEEGADVEAQEDAEAQEDVEASADAPEVPLDGVD